MQGHTNKATINQRRPLTPNMIETLRSIAWASDPLSRSLHKCLFKGEMTEAEKNAARALLDRGMVDWDTGLQGYRIKDSGRAALNEQCGSKDR